MAAAVKQELTGRNIRLLAGTNMPAAIEAVFSRVNAGLDELTELAAAAGARGVVDFEHLGQDKEQLQFEDGI